MRWSCLSAVVMDTRPKPTGSRSFFARSSRRMSSKVRGHQDHGGPVKEVGPAVLKAGEVGPRHGVAPQEGEAILFRQGKTFWHTFSLCRRAVDDHGVGLDLGRQPLHVLHHRLGIGGQEEEVQLPQPLLREGAWMAWAIWANSVMDRSVSHPRTVTEGSRR